ncbi:hypothetical protein R8Z50_10855 [Longispora sp. K20-0274]|uniref:hypothetical protein n=1 Tax=Longispora sp. K20-0274 TaxID=3088255 RepID=UPI00399BE08C
MRSLALLVPVAVLLLAGCGGQPSATHAAETSARPVPAATTSPGTDGTLEIGQDGAAPPNTLWYARIETPESKVVVESAYPAGPIALTKQLAAGRYRVIAWHRACTGACPTSGEKGLGPLEEVCGAVVTVTAAARVTARVVIDGDGACMVHTPAAAAQPTP